VQVAEVKALACQLPAETGLPLSRWSCPDLADEIVARGIAPAISPSTIRRILAAEALKPWQYQSWIFIRDARAGGARAYHDLQRARGVSHNAALRQLANRLVGILHSR
jgi:hypothetical protein